MSVETEGQSEAPKMIQSFEEWQAEKSNKLLSPPPDADSEWAEKPANTPLTRAEIQERRDIADGVIEMPSEEEKVAEAFVNDILTQAREGKLISSDGKTKYSEEDMRFRLADLARGLNKGVDETGFKELVKLMPRSGGLRQSIEDTVMTEGLGDAFTENITKIYWQVEREKAEALRSEEKLKEVGDESLESSGVEDPGEDLDSFDVKAAEAARQSIQPEVDRFPTKEEIARAMSGEPDEPVVEQKSRSAKEEVAGLPIEIQRSIKDYEMYMTSADRNIKINGYNRDAEDERRRADDILRRLPTGFQELAKRYRQEQKNY